MKQRLAAPSDGIDLTKIKELVGIETSADTLTIKAATTHFGCGAKWRRARSLR
jgi:carbon-monoxide dehydrogenase medium subunit